MLATVRLAASRLGPWTWTRDLILDTLTFIAVMWAIQRPICFARLIFFSRLALVAQMQTHDNAYGNVVQSRDIMEFHDFILLSNFDLLAYRLL